MNYEDYVCGTKFRDLAHLWLDNGVERWQEFHTRPELSIYCATHDFNKSIEQIKKFSDRVVLITHNSDGAVRDGRTQEIREHDADYSKLPDNVIKWYAQNVDLPGQHMPSNLVPIPIGLENRYCFDYDKAEMLFEEAKKPVKKNHKIYVNFNVNTNRAQRVPALKEANKHGDICSIRLGTNGEDYQRYLEELHVSSAALCPPGNGLDCHRTWEGLYLGTIPIMKHVLSIEAMAIPTLFLMEWEELNCRNNLDYYLNNCRLPEFIPQLSMKYWTERIMNAS